MRKKRTPKNAGNLFFLRDNSTILLLSSFTANKKRNLLPPKTTPGEIFLLFLYLISSLKILKHSNKPNDNFQ
jgi:hypothetical protein